ncbi:MAG: anhydro-N-acetylmuramic acid kinase [Bacteroidales bacterium]|nr:anhydro-N-acetylmuramic acid kinase [Bacteroidales bacterium]
MHYKVIGLMSGTSLDGLDIAYCLFSIENGRWSYSIEKAETIEYSSELKNKLIEAENTTSLEFAKIDKEFGHFIGKEVRIFIDKYKLEVDFVCSHGQTIFHQPQINLTTQIGDINSIASQTMLKTIGDFRRLDIALGGQGAPLVPIGDRLLFADYPYCLNLGGFSNISFEENGLRIAYDICPVNIVLNYLAQKEGYDYDKDGQLARSGKVNNIVLEQLNSLDYYKTKDKKSLGKEWVIENIFPLLQNSKLSNIDQITTYVEHIAQQLYGNINGDVLITGGGVFNEYLIERLQSKLTNHKIFIPHPTIINYKEALIFAFLGVLRERKEINTLSSVTGAIKDSCGGLIVEY